MLNIASVAHLCLASFIWAWANRIAPDAALIIGFTYGQSIFFKSCDCRSEGVVPANTLKKLGKKKKI